MKRTIKLRPEFLQKNLLIHEYTGEVLGERTDPAFLDYVHQFHIRLLAGHTGQSIMGIAGIAMLILVISGFILWWRHR
jgi:uncharacterized iron-regulated membrane protein